MAPDKRQEILDQLKAAVASFRHCLELQPDNAHARRDIELVRQWIKYYTDKWHARDRETRRQETNLVAFLEFLIETQRALRESVKALTATSPSDAFAEPKRLQDELQQEIPPLKEKIKTELTPKPSAGGSAPQGNSSELEQGIKLLQDWATAAGEKMASAARHLDGRQAAPAAADQQAAIDELEKIWDAVIPFHALLARDLADQTKIAGSLAPPDSAADSKSGNDEPSGKNDPHRDETGPASKDAIGGYRAHASLGTESDDLAPLTEIQQRTLRRTQLLKLKAEAELERMEKPHPPDAAQKGDDSSLRKRRSAGCRGRQAKTGRSQADQGGLSEGDRAGAASRPSRWNERSNRSNRRILRRPTRRPTQARKILEEIQKAQPRQDQQDQKQQDQNKKNEDQKKQDQKDQQKKDEQKKEQQKDDREKKDQEKKDQEKKDQEQKKQEEPNKSDEQKPDQKQPQPQVSRDRIEEALRRVRERQQEKRERDRMMKARVFGRAPVEKDW